MVTLETTSTNDLIPLVADTECVEWFKYIEYDMVKCGIYRTQAQMLTSSFRSTYLEHVINPSIFTSS